MILHFLTDTPSGLIAIRGDIACQANFTLHDLLAKGLTLNSLTPEESLVLNYFFEFLGTERRIHWDGSLRELWSGLVGSPTRNPCNLGFTAWSGHECRVLQSAIRKKCPMPDTLRTIIVCYAVQAESGYENLFTAYERFSAMLEQTDQQVDQWLVMVSEPG